MRTSTPTGRSKPANNRPASNPTGPKVCEEYLRKASQNKAVMKQGNSVLWDSRAMCGVTAHWMIATRGGSAAYTV